MKKTETIITAAGAAEDANFTFQNSIDENQADVWFGRDAAHLMNRQAIAYRLSCFAPAPHPKGTRLIHMEEGSGDYKASYFPSFFERAKSFNKAMGSDIIFVTQQAIHDFAYKHIDREDPVLRQQGFMAFLKNKNGELDAVFVIGQGEQIQFQISPVSEYDGSVSQYWNFLLPT